MMLGKRGILQSGKRDLLTACRARRLPSEHPVPVSLRCRESRIIWGSWSFKVLAGIATITKTQSPTREQVKLRLHMNHQLGQKRRDRTFIEFLLCARGILYLCLIYLS